MNEKFCRYSVAFIGLLSILAWTEPAEMNFENSHLDEQEAIIRERIPSVVTIVNPVYTPAVRSYLNTYIYRRPDQTANMIGWAKYYFPKFEKALREEGLPTDLKYLAIVESALNPTAISRSGAGGLWQFMKPTARECGLKCGTYVDERMDPEKSSKAAAHYLKRLYGMFENWELVMAAYNAGPGRVKYAMRRSGSSDYWKVARYLPRETQSYVPGFIAASYLLNFHSEHDIIPVDPLQELGAITSIVLYQGMHLTEIAKRAGLPFETVKALNPSYVRNYVPTSSSGNAVWLPVSAVQLFESAPIMDVPPATEYREEESTLASINEKKVVIGGELYTIKTIRNSYTVRKGDNLYDIARKNNCTVKEIMSWNKLHSSRLAIGQKLILQKVVRELVPILVTDLVPTPVVAREEISLPSLPTLMSGTIPGEGSHRSVHISVEPELPVKSDNSIVLKRRQCLRQALGPVQFNASLQLIMPDKIAPGDVVKWKTKA